MDHIEEDYESHITKKEFIHQYSVYCRMNKLKGVSDRYIKNLLAEEYGAIEERPQLDDERVLVWQGIKFIHSKVTNVSPVRVVRGI